MQAVEAITTMRFDVFPHVPDTFKMQMSQTFLRLNYLNPEVQHLLNIAFKLNRATLIQQGFQRRRGHFRSICHTMDYEAILAIYWKEPERDLATRLLTALLRFARHIEEALFVTTEFNRPWAIAVNLLHTARSAEDKEAVLVYLAAYQDTMPILLV
jgi:hypothetical protein